MKYRQGIVSNAPGGAPEPPTPAPAAPTPAQDAPPFDLDDGVDRAQEDTF